MACDSIRQEALDLNWGRDDWQKARRVIAHVDGCAECRDVLLGYDQVRSVLTGGMDRKDVEPTGGWDAFEARMAVRAVRPKVRRWPIWSAAAAALLIGACAGWAVQWKSSVGGKGGAPELARPFTAGEVAEHTVAFGKVAEVFEGKTAWMLISNVDSDMGVAEKSGAGKELMLLRLTMTDGKKVVSQADLVMVPGQHADPVIPFVNGQKLRYRVTAPVSGSREVAVWVRVERGGGGEEPVAALGSSLVAANAQALPVGQLVTPTGRYELSVALTHSTL